MILKTEIIEDPARISKEADQRLPSTRYTMASGHTCVVTPEMKKQPGGSIRVMLTYAWTSLHTPAEQSEIERHFCGVLGKGLLGQEIFHAEHVSRADILRLRDKFLNPKKKAQ